MIALPKKTDVICQELRQSILSGELKVGDRLPTEPELAQKFDCSIGTVSKAVALLVHEGLVKRRPRTGSRVINSGSVPHNRGISLEAFAFIYPSSQHESSWRMLKSFQKAAVGFQRRIVTLDTGVNYQKEAEYIGRLMEFDVCGAAISPLLLTPQDFAHFCGLLLKSSIPIVLLGTRLQGLDCPAVFFDAFHAGYKATRHLLENGSRKIGFLCNHVTSTRNYFSGYSWALEEYGIKPQPNWLLCENSMHPDYDHPMVEPAVLGARFLEKCSEVEAVVCSHDYLALGVIEASIRAGRSVPGDLKVVGIDDLEFSMQGKVPLTSYHFPFEEVGEKAFAMLHALVTGDASFPREIQMRGDLIRRESA